MTSKLSLDPKLPKASRRKFKTKLNLRNFVDDKTDSIRSTIKDGGKDFPALSIYAPQLKALKERF